MKIAKISTASALLFGLIGVMCLRSAAGTNSTATSATIFVANSFNVNAFPIGSNGDVAPIVLPTGMVNPSGFARDASGRIYVTNAANGTVAVYAADANGNVPPIAVIVVLNTQLTSPSGIALDASGKIYVLCVVGYEESIAVYPPLGTSTGILNEAPVAVITGSNTLLDNPAALTLDSDGKIYVANGSGGPAVPGKPHDHGMVTVYPAGSNGNVAPVTTISGAATGFASPAAIALDSDGNIYVVNSFTANVSRKHTFKPSITVYPAGSMGNEPPIAIITGDKTGLSLPEGVALDSRHNLYVTSFTGPQNSVNVYPAGSDGNVSPTTTIAGADTGLVGPVSVALDSHGNVYVLNVSGGPEYIGSVTVYPAGSTGNAAPSATITSNIVGLDYASGIALDSLGNIYVTNELDGARRDGSVAIYPAGSYVSVPPTFKIAGHHTRLNAPYGIALDSNDNVAVLNSDHGVTMYPAGSSGDVRPSARIKIDRGGYNAPAGIAIGPGDKLYVVNLLKQCPGQSCVETGPGDVAVYPADSNGNANPSAVIRGPRTQLAFPSAIAVDHSGDIYVANGGPGKCTPPCGCFPTGPGSVTVYAPGSKGDVKPITTISGPNTALVRPDGLALDSNGNLYVLNAPGFIGMCVTEVLNEQATATNRDPGVPPYSFGTNGPILIFAAGSAGDVAPIAAIGGPLTGLDFFPAGIAVGPGGP